MLRASNEDVDLTDYFLENCDSLFRQVYPDESIEMEDYTLKKVNNDLIVYFSVKKHLLQSLKKRMIG